VAQEPHCRFSGTANPSLEETKPVAGHYPTFRIMMSVAQRCRTMPHHSHRLPRNWGYGRLRMPLSVASWLFWEADACVVASFPR
jgi:hypothetical protein